MIKKEIGPVRYDMSHGEILRSDALDATLSLSAVISILYARESITRLMELKDRPLKIPEGASISILYRTPQHTVREIIGESVLCLSDEEASELKQAMLESDNDFRPIVSYSNMAKDSGAVARFITVYVDDQWKCVQATNITYEEANFVYELLVKYNFAA